MKNKIVLVPFPFDDLSSSKVRPAVCLTNSITKRGHIVIAFITSHMPEEKEKSDVVMLPDSKTGLKVKSCLRLHRLTTVSSSIIKRELGKISSAKAEEINNKLRALFSLE